MMDTQLVRGDVHSALEWAGRAVLQYRTLAHRDPAKENSRQKLWMTLADRAETFTRLGRHGEALADYEEILELTRHSRPGDLFRVFHALTKARLGDLSALELLGNQVRQTVKLGAGNGASVADFDWYMTYYDAACIHAALAKLAFHDPGRPLADRQRLARADLEHVLELLHKARETGEFNGMIRLDEVRRERLLDPLRSDPRFQLLMMDLAFPDDPFEHSTDVTLRGENKSASSSR